MHAVESVWCCAPLQAVQTAHGHAPETLHVLPAVQALATQLPPLAVLPAAQPQTALDEAVHAEAIVCCAPLQAAQAAHGKAPEALHVLPATHAANCATSADESVRL